MKTVSHWGAIRAKSHKMDERIQIHSQINEERMDSRIFTKELYEARIKKIPIDHHSTKVK